MTIVLAGLLGLLCGLPFRRGRARAVGGLLGLALGAILVFLDRADVYPLALGDWLRIGAGAALGGALGLVGPAAGPGWRRRWPGGAGDPVAAGRW